MLSIILAKKIFSLFLIMAMSWLLVKCKMLKASDSRIVSVLLLYMFFPCVILYSFQVDFTDQVKQGLLLGVFAAVVIHAMYLGICAFLGRVMGMTPVEKCSVIYSNSGNLMIPLVIAILGQEWVIYTSSFMAVQLVLFWSHLKSEISGEATMDWKAVVTNVNMLAIMVGLVLLFTGWRFPAPVNDALGSLGVIVGPSAMIIAGLLLGEMDFRKLLSYKRMPLIALLRLIVVPLISLVVLKYSGMAKLAEQGDMVLLITLLACATPSATTVVSMASLFSEEGEYASAINVVTAILCIFTMPLIVAVYQW